MGDPVDAQAVEDGGERVAGEITEADRRVVHALAQATAWTVEDDHPATRQVGKQRGEGEAVPGVARYDQHRRPGADLGDADPQPQAGQRDRVVGRIEPVIVVQPPLGLLGRDDARIVRVEGDCPRAAAAPRRAHDTTPPAWPGDDATGD